MGEVCVIDSKIPHKYRAVLLSALIPFPDLEKDA